MPAYLFPKTDQYLDPKEIASRVARSFPIVSIDWALGNEKVARSLERLIEMDVPEVIVESHKSQLDQTAHVKIGFPEFPGQHVEFVVSPHSRLSLKCSDHGTEKLLQHVASRLASVLEYELQMGES